jgi:predicted RNA binding protein YcfA (HicA-like mRNA interferase family)
MKVREVIRKLQEDGWYRVDTAGSHHHFKHPTKSGKVTVAGNMSDDVKIGTLRAIERASGVKLK